jgi:cyclopropane-fatty-acyl-phospholipid synthase
MSTEQHYTVLPQSSRPVGKALKPPYKARLGLALLRRAKRGYLLLIDPKGQEHRFGDLNAASTQRGIAPAIWILHDWSVFERALSRGDVGFGECWMDGLWDSPDPAAVLRFMLKNRASLDQGIYGTWLGQWIDRLRHHLRRNSRSGSRRNIQAHYDLGNDFYRLWLDPSMTYSSALREESSDSLEQAQLRKYERILDELQLNPGANLLEIGCGWGGFALRARRRGLHLKCLTLSTEQLSYAQAMHRRESSQGTEGLGRAEFCLQDYRDEQGRYDAIVSIEMFEAVGQAYWDSYFHRLYKALKPGGKALIQSITIDEQYFERYRASTDFIQQYIFPGGMLPSPQAVIALARKHGLELCNTLRFGPDYAWTLARWHERFIAVEKEVRQLGYDERFIRMWRFYLAYCEAGFAEGATDVVQFSFVRA